MEGKQKICFTCSKPILDRLNQYEHYRNVYGLSRTDAADKAELQNICCRTTAFAQTGVEKRIAAAGQVDTVENRVRVQGIKPYPTSKVTRKYEEGPFTHSDVELAPRLRDKISYEVFSGTQPDINTVPTRRAFDDQPSQPKVNTRMSNRPIVGDLGSYPDGKWTLLDRRTFPKEDELEEIFNTKIAVIHLVCPMLSNETLTVVTFPAGTRVEAALEEFERVMVTQDHLLSEKLITNNVVSAPQRLLKILQILQAGKHLSIIDLTGATLNVSKVYRDIKRKVYVMEMTNVAPIKLRKSKLQEDLLRFIVESKVSRLETTESGFVLTIGSAIVKFNNFTLHSRRGDSNKTSDLQIGSVLKGVRQEDLKLLLSFQFKAELYVLSITGDIEVSGVDRLDMSIDEKRMVLLKMLDSL